MKIGLGWDGMGWGGGSGWYAYCAVHGMVVVMLGVVCITMSAGDGGI
jgi:hypothetical protein